MALISGQEGQFLPETPGNVLALPCNAADLNDPRWMRRAATCGHSYGHVCDLCSLIGRLRAVFYRYAVLLLAR